MLTTSCLDIRYDTVSFFLLVLSFLCTLPRTAAPHTPRVLLLGPTGSGKSLHASQLSRKYHLVDVDFDLLIKQVMASGNKLSLSIKPFQERGMMSECKLGSRFNH